MNRDTSATGLVGAMLVSGLLLYTAEVSAEGRYPTDYKPSTPAAQGAAATNPLKRLGALADYMNEKLNATGGKDSPLCYRNCLTIPLNDVIKCLETKTTYATSEECEQDAAQKMTGCDPKCQ